MVTKENSILFVDFEKSPPHFPQMDLISFINSRNQSIEYDFQIIEYYLEKNNIVNSDDFYYCYDLLFVIDNLRSLIKIYNNTNEKGYVWEKSDGVLTKTIQPLNNNMGNIWNKTRGESFKKRINNIFNKMYSKQKYSIIIREIVKELL